MFIEKVLGKSLFNGMIGSISLPVLFGCIVAHVLGYQQMKWISQSSSIRDKNRTYR